MRAFILVLLLFASAQVARAQDLCPPGSPASCNPENGETPLDCEQDHFQEGCEFWVNDHCGWFQIEGPSSANPEGIWELICIMDPYVGQIRFDLDCSCNRIDALGDGVWTGHFSGSVPHAVCTGVLFCSCYNGVFVGCTGVAPPECEQYIAGICARDWESGDADDWGGHLDGDEFHNNPDFPGCNGCHDDQHPTFDLSKLLRDADLMSLIFDRDRDL